MVMQALSRQGALFLFWLTLVASGSVVIVHGYLNSVHLPGGDSQHLQDDNCHLALFAIFVAKASVGCGGCKRLQGSQSLCEITTDGFILGANRHGSRSRK